MHDIDQLTVDVRCFQPEQNGALFVVKKDKKQTTVYVGTAILQGLDGLRRRLRGSDLICDDNIDEVVIRVVKNKLPSLYRFY